MFGFLNKKRSASLAKDRLTIAIMSDRSNLKDFPYMEEIKTEIIAVVKKYIGVKKIEINTEHIGDSEALSIDVILDK
ncbi:MAG: cell division topological specificity factor MinE [Epsilonproteobacteria bacterium]|nr:MAG: cell division topological specificity factor MinE [Campylobacterota bacterium]